MDEALTDEAVRLAYRLLLGREVESEEMLRFARGYGTLARLRDAFLNSREFEYILNLRPRLIQPGAPPLAVSWQADDAAALAMLAAVRATWDTAPPPKTDGARQADDVFATLRRNGLTLPDKPRGFELGCGTGRVTRHLAPHLHSLTASDAAPAQMRPLDGVRLRPAADLSFGMTDPFDFWYSFHALQHSPPPLAARVLARAFALLRPGGIAVFQLVTYAAGYSYPSDAPRHANPYDDMDVLPQPAVFAIAAEAGCAPVEVFEDLSVTPSALWRSTIFVMRKHAA